MSAFANIPDELCQCAQWVCWRIVQRDGKPTKMPVQPSGAAASSTDPKTWSTFEQVRTARSMAGIGFVFTKEAGFTGIDLDKCRNSETGETEPWALAIIEELNSYTEISQSGKGWHVIVQGSLSPGRNRAGRVEMYDSGRFFVMTGDVGFGTGVDVIMPRDPSALQKRMAEGTLEPKQQQQQNPTNIDDSAEDWRLIAEVFKATGAATADELEEEFRNAYRQRYSARNSEKKDRAGRNYFRYTIENFIARQATHNAEPQTDSLPTGSNWPAPMADEAFHGLAGDFVRLVEPETEADPVALLANFLITAGVLFGREAWVVADGKRHYPIEYLLMTGRTGTGRKGTATGRVLPIIECVDADFHSRVLSGLSSGEGLIKGISRSEGEDPDTVRRFLALLPEFANLLGVMKREGNTMSAILREAWDGGRLRVLTRKEPLDVDNVNLSVIAHITPGELLNGLTETDRVNGFANRFLITCVRRSKCLPEGGGEVNASEIVQRLHQAVASAKGRGQIQRDSQARELWAAEYIRLTGDREGLKGALCSRAEAHVLRLSLLYALLDCAAEIRIEHLRAALAFWAYCEASVGHLFGDSTGDPEADKILIALASGALTTDEIRRTVFWRNKESEWVAGKLVELERAGRVVQTLKDGDRKKGLTAWGLKSTSTTRLRHITPDSQGSANKALSSVVA